MPDPLVAEKIENWVSDFCSSDRAREAAAAAREHASQVLGSLLSTACDARGLPPEALEEGDFKAGLLEGVARLELPASVLPELPSLCALFLAELQDQGRLAGGRASGLFVKALKEPLLAAAGGKTQPIRSAGSRIGRNDPCPCGSGLKYKKCCLRRM